MVSYAQNQPKNGLIRHLSYSLIGNLRISQREVTKIWQKLIKIDQLAIKTYFFPADSEFPKILFEIPVPDLSLQYTTKNI